MKCLGRVWGFVCNKWLRRYIRSPKDEDTQTENFSHRPKVHTQLGTCKARIQLGLLRW